jgi:conserved oligomeric Golgi complex subunit 6
MEEVGDSSVPSNVSATTTETATTMTTKTNTIISSSSSSSSNVGLSHSNSILSERVARALAVRTDTVAMKTALEALQASYYSMSHDAATLGVSSLAHSNNSTSGVGSKSTTTSTTNSTSGGLIVDSRSVRTAMEYDTLQQALHLQESMQAMLQVVTQLRTDSHQIVQMAQAIRATIHTSSVSSVSVMTSRHHHHHHLHGGAKEETDYAPKEDRRDDVYLDNSRNNNNNDGHSDDDDDDDKEEHKLATEIAVALRHRNMVQARVETLQLFVQQYHLSDDDTALLEQYNFQNVLSTNTNTTNNVGTDLSNQDGLAFLEALVRVRNIRNALQKRFGGSTNVGSRSGRSTARGGGGGGEGVVHHPLYDPMFLTDDDGSSSGSNHPMNTNTTTTTSSTAFKMMEQLATLQESAYERLYHWLQQYLQLNYPNNTNLYTTAGTNTTGTNIDSPPPPPPQQQFITMYEDDILQNEFVVLAVQSLQYVPAFYNHCIELIASQRRTMVTRKFLIALTVGTTNSGGSNHNTSNDPYDNRNNHTMHHHPNDDLRPMPPIEMKAHDSVACT